MMEKTEVKKGRRRSKQAAPDRQQQMEIDRMETGKLRREMDSLIKTIQFLEKVSARFHGILDEDEIYRIIREEFARSKRYAMSIMLLDEDGTSLRIKETSLARGKISAAEKLSGLRLKTYRFNLNNSKIFSRIVKKGETVQVGAGEVIGEMSSGKLIQPILRLTGYKNMKTVITPLRCHKDISGALSISSTDLPEYFVPSVINFAQHICSALALARENAGRIAMEKALTESEAKYRAIFENSQDGINLSKMDFTTGKKQVVEMNQAFIKQSGFDEKELRRGNIYTRQLSAYTPGEVRRQDEGWKKGETLTGQFSWKRPDKKENRMEFTSIPVNIEGKTYILGIDRDATRRTLVEEALRESEKRFRELTEQLPEIVIETDTKGNITFANPVAFEITGYSPDDLRTGLNILKMVIPEDQKKAKENFARSARGEKLGLTEYAICRKDGTVIPTVIHSQAIIDHAGTVRGLRAMVVDITERKQIEEALAESEDKYRNLVERANDGIGIVQDRLIKYANPQVARITGHSIDEVIGSDFESYLLDKEREKVLDRYRRRMKGEEIPAVYEAVFRHKKGHEVHIEINAGLITYEGKPADLFFARDITERKRAEDEIRIQRDRAQHYLDIAGVMILALNDKGQVILINAKGCQVLGYPEEEILGKNWFDNFVPERLSKELKTVFNKLIAGEIQPVEYYENPVLTKDGEERIIAWHNTVIRDKDGKKVETLSSGEDITERVKAVETLRDNELKLRNIVEYSLDGIVLCDEDWRIIEWNSGQEHITGIERDKVLGRNLADVQFDAAVDKMSRATKESIKAEMNKFSKTGKAPWLYRLLDHDISNPDGTTRSMQAMVFPIKTDNGYMACGISRDVTEIKEAEKQMQIKDSALQCSINAIAFADLDGKLTYVNPTFLKLWGYNSEQEVLGLLAVDYWQAEEKATKVIEQVHKTGSWIGEQVAKRKDGSFFDVQLSANMVMDRDNKPICIMSSFIDITERKRYEEKLLRAAIYDSLTGVYNRRHLMERLESSVRSALRHHYSVSICLCDIDNFKAINDLYGHLAGDDVLARFGRIVRDELRLEDVVGRYGGDEFCMIFPHTGTAETCISIERIRTHLEEVIFKSAKGNFSITGTFGVAELTSRDKDEKTLLDAADQALYQAKDLGRNRVVVKKD